MFASSEQEDERKSRYAGGPHGLGMHTYLKFNLYNDIYFYCHIILN